MIQRSSRVPSSRSARRAGGGTPLVSAPRFARLRSKFNTRLPFSVPGVVLYGTLVLVPLILSVYYSFTDRTRRRDESFVGWDNYLRLLSDESFLSSFAFTATVTVATLLLVNALGLALALLLNRVGRLFFAMRMIFFIPIALSGVVAAFIWSRILTDQGLLNTWLSDIGLGDWALTWLGDPKLAQGSVIAIAIWQALGLCIVVYLAGLQTIPHELLDAARVDGGTRWQGFRHVTWPLLAPSVTINSTLLLINGFKTYDVPIVLTGTGPGGATATAATEIIRVGFTLNRVGLASAMAIILLLAVGLVTAIAVWVLQKREVEL